MHLPPIDECVVCSKEEQQHASTKAPFPEDAEKKKCKISTSHSIDKAAVKRIGEQLKDRGLLPWLDEWELRPGLPWQKLLEEQIGSIKSAAVFVGKKGVGPWQRQELDAFLREFAERRCPVIPVLLEEAPSEPQLPIFLKGMTWVDFRHNEPEPWNQLEWGITGKRGW